jgi:hypothetical protein
MAIVLGEESGQFFEQGKNEALLGVRNPYFEYREDYVISLSKKPTFLEGEFSRSGVLRRGWAGPSGFDSR